MNPNKEIIHVGNDAAAAAEKDQAIASMLDVVRLAADKRGVAVVAFIEMDEEQEKVLSHSKCVYDADLRAGPGLIRVLTGVLGENLMWMADNVGQLIREEAEES